MELKGNYKISYEYAFKNLKFEGGMTFGIKE